MVGKRAIGRSGLEVAPLVLGGNVFGWTADEATSFRILDAFVDAGGTMIDTADVYSFWVEGHKGGESETVIGRWLQRDPAKRDKVLIGTKVGFIDGLSPDAIRTACEGSLRRLATDRIDIYYEHTDDEKVPLAESLGAMDGLVRAGKVRAVGLSQFTAPRVEEAVRVAEAEGFARPCALQTWYSLLDRDRFEGPLRDAAIANDIGVLPFYALANGFLTGKYRSRDDISKSVRGTRILGYFDAKGPQVLAAMDEIAAETGAALATIALAWTMRQPGIVAPLASATSLEQLQDLIASLSFQLTPGQLERLDSASAEAVAA